MKRECEITERSLRGFERYLVGRERAAATVTKYLSDVRRFAAWSGGKLTRETAAGWKEALTASGLAATSVNSRVSSLNAYCAYAGLPFREPFLRIQRRLFRSEARELSSEEFFRLVAAARRAGRERLALILETIAGTGVRVSELRYVTVTALQRGSAEIALKGKIRKVFIPKPLCARLLAWAKKEKLRSGSVFVTSHGTPVSRTQIWQEMKSLCERAGVAQSKVFPHNLRHLFAAEYYRVSGDIVLLSDVLGHSSVETTRLYLASSGTEHRRNLSRMRILREICAGSPY